MLNELKAGFISGITFVKSLILLVSTIISSLLFFYIMYLAGWKGVLCFGVGMFIMAYLLMGKSKPCLMLQSILKYAEGSILDDEAKK